MVSVFHPLLYHLGTEGRSDLLELFAVFVVVEP